MHDDRLARPERTMLFGVVTDCNNKVEFYALVLVPRLGASIGSVNFVNLSKNPNRIRINCGAWISARAVRLEFSLAEFSREEFTENASRTIACAKEQNLQGAMIVHTETALEDSADLPFEEEVTHVDTRQSLRTLFRRERSI